MKAAIITPGRDVSGILENLHALDPEFQPEVWPDVKDPSEISIALVWRTSEEILKKFTNLKLICSFGAGIDHILFNSGIGEKVQISRLVDPALTHNVTKFCLMALFAYEKSLNEHIENKRIKRWGWKEDIPVGEVGIFGMGVIGAEIAVTLRDLGYTVNGYSLNPKEIEGIQHYYGKENLNAFVQRSDVLVNVMPLTFETRCFFDRDFFRKCKPGTYFINLGRGQHVSDRDLLDAIESGIISGATLDVFNQEPLPEDHPFWECNKITITPHIAGLTLPKSAAIQFYENFNRLKNNQPLLNLIDRKKGY